MSPESVSPDPEWPDDLHELPGEHGVIQFACVPDANYKTLINRLLAEPDVNTIALTAEMEDVAMLAGVDLGGARGVLIGRP